MNQDAYQQAKSISQTVLNQPDDDWSVPHLLAVLTQAVLALTDAVDDVAAKLPDPPV